jgi:hypothetical protein
MDLCHRRRHFLRRGQSGRQLPGVAGCGKAADVVVGQLTVDTRGSGAPNNRHPLSDPAKGVLDPTSGDVLKGAAALLELT